MLNKLRRYADIYNIAVVITNQVVSYTDNSQFGSDYIKPAGGNIMGHSSTYRIFLKRSGKNRVAIMFDSPYHPNQQVKFSISDEGIKNENSYKGHENVDEGDSGWSAFATHNDETSKPTSVIIDRDYYPDPRSLPKPPSFQETIPSVTLSELEPGKYVSIQARIVYLKTVEKHDALGEKVVFSGLVEDATFKVPFVSHKISFPLIRDSVYRFYSAFVHEFSDKSLLLVITEHTKIDPKNIEDIREFTWSPKLGAINRPVRNIYLNGTISTIHSTSGLVKRCNKCKSLIYYDNTKCPKDCGMGWAWDLRISGRLYDSSGTMKIVITKDIAPPRCYNVT